MTETKPDVAKDQDSSQWSPGNVVRILGRRVVNRKPLLLIRPEGNPEIEEFVVERMVVHDFAYYLCLRPDSSSSKRGALVVEIMASRKAVICDAERSTEIRLNFDDTTAAVVDLFALAQLLGDFKDEQASQTMQALVKRGKGKGKTT